MEFCVLVCTMTFSVTTKLAPGTYLLPVAAVGIPDAANLCEPAASTHVRYVLRLS